MSWQELSPREEAVLSAVERRLGNAEIAAEFHISVRTVESHIAALRRKLGVDTRPDLIEAARARRGTAVPVPANSFVGRDSAVKELTGLLERTRWVTVLGPAGCGKTRLALELAAGGTRVPVVADLAHTPPAEVPAALAGAVGLGAVPRADLAASCAVTLGARPYLLVLDNVDRVATAIGPLVGELLAAAPALRVLATSRSPAGGAEEVLYPLEPLPSAAASQLFVDRAGAALPRDADPELVEAICERLDGLPLAVELAAARARHLPLPELASGLRAGLGLLARAGATGRHGTLAAAIGWTWDLLDADEQAALSRLAALPGTFDLPLAAAVTAGPVEQVLARLLDRSLVSPAGAGGGHTGDRRRFRILEAVRAFVTDRSSLAVSREVRQAHADYHAALAAELAADARRDDSKQAVRRAKRLFPELVAAIDWALTAQPVLALRIATDLAVLAEQYGPDTEGLAAIERVARDPRARAVVTVPELFLLGEALLYCNLDLVAELAELALAAERDRDGAAELAAQMLAGFADSYRHVPRRALEHLARAEQLALQRADDGDLWQLGQIRQAMGVAHRDLDDPPAALAAFETAMHDYARAGDTMHVNNARYMMAATAASTGVRTADALGWAEQCIAYATETGNQHELAHAELTRATLVSEPDRAALAWAIDTFRALGDLRCVARCHLMLADGQPAAAQLPQLTAALEIATRARDSAHRATALERLMHARWELGAHREAALDLGELTAIVGEAEALTRAPDGLRADIPRWRTTVAEGRARTR